MKWICVAAALLAGCTVTREPGRTYTPTGKDLGPSARQSVTLADSKVSFTGDKDPVRSREVLSLKDRYSEHLILENGANLDYDKLHMSGFKGSETDADILQWELEHPGYSGITFDRGAVKRSGVFTYIISSSQSKTCFAFHGTFGDTNKGPRDNRGNQETFGGICYSSSVRTAAALETEMLSLLGRVRFDDGAINRGRAAGGATPLAVPSPALAPEPGVVSSRQSSPATLNVAYRLRELHGLLDQGLITQAEYDQRRQAILGS